MDFLLGTKILEKRKSKFNGEIKVIRNLAFGTYIQAGGITQSGGIVESIWKQNLKKIVNCNRKAGYSLKINNCLILGLGGGSAAKLVKKLWPKAKITGIDIDPQIVELGKKYLGLDEVQVQVQDAYEFVTQTSKLKTKNYDLVLVDVYLGREFPKKFEEEKFLELVLRLLSKGGVAVFNRLYYGEKRPEAMKFGKKLEKVFKKVEYFYPQANLTFVCYN